MTDRARFDVILGDKVSPGARSGAASVSAMQRQLRALNAEARSSSAALSRWGVRIQRDFGAEMRAIRSLNNTSYTLGRASGFSFQQWGAGTRLATTRTAELSDRFAGLGGALGTLAAGTAAAAAGFGRITYEAGSAYLSVARFREDSLTSLGTVLGSQRAAGRSFGNALIMANQTPLDPQDVISSFTNFAVGGFSERELSPLAAAVADVQAARGQTAADSLTRVLTQIRGLGRVMRGDITMQGISAGLNAGDIFESIARQMNLGSGRAGIKAAEAAVSHGRVNDRIAIQAFLESVRKRYDRGANLGTFARNSSNTLTGALSNLRGAMFTLMAGLDLGNTPGVKALRDSVLAITGALDAGSESGRELRAVIVEGANMIGTELFGGITKDALVRDIRAMIPLLRGAMYVGRGAAMAIRQLYQMGVIAADVVGYVGRGFGTWLDTLITDFNLAERMVEELAGLPDRVMTVGRDAAASILTGFTEGLLQSPTTISGAVEGAFTDAVTTARTVLDWHSPSGVFKEAGASVAAGFELGIAGGASGARDAVAQLVAPREVTAPATGAGGFVFAPNISIDGRGRSDAELVDMMMERLHDLFESMQLQGATHAPTR